jgi:hypothetical protein
MSIVTAITSLFISVYNIRIRRVLQPMRRTAHISERYHLRNWICSIFCDVTACSAVESQQKFWGKMSPSKKLTWRWRRHITPKHMLEFKRHSIISQKIYLFITTALRTSIPTTLDFIGDLILWGKGKKNNKLRGFSSQANYTDRETAACRRS